MTAVDHDSGRPHGVLFVCHANMCRSPLAAGVFAHLAQQRGVTEHFEIDSAGAWAAEGIAPHPLSVAVAQQHGIDVALLGTASRALVPDDLDRFADIVVMDRRNLADLERLRRISTFGPVVGGSARISLLRSFACPEARGRDSDVADPVRGGPELYDAAFSIIESSCRALLESLLADEISR